MEEYDAYEKEFNAFFPDLIKTLPHLLNNINFYQD
jgi:hypothetical protein